MRRREALELLVVHHTSVAGTRVPVTSYDALTPRNVSRTFAERDSVAAVRVVEGQHRDGQEEP